MLDGWDKRALLIEYGKKSGLSTFIETGTSDCNTVCFVAPHFDRVFSIEIAQDFYDNAIIQTVDVPNATIIHGDSATVLEWLLPAIDKPCLFWLDAHYNGRGDGKNPIKTELLHAFHRKHPHWILIDDAREFGVDPAYPTIEWIEEFLRQEMLHGAPDYKFSIEDDIMRIIPEL